VGSISFYTALLCPSLADLAWPILFFKTSILYWASVAAGLLIETAWIRRFFHKPWTQSLFIAGTMNLATGLIGIVLIPLVIVAGELCAGLFIHRIVDMGQFDLPVWAAAFASSVLINTALEGTVIKKVFHIPWRKRGFWILCAIHTVNAGMILGWLLMFPARELTIQ